MPVLCCRFWRLRFALGWTSDFLQDQSLDCVDEFRLSGKKRIVEFLWWPVTVAGGESPHKWQYPRSPRTAVLAVGTQFCQWLGEHVPHQLGTLKSLSASGHQLFSSQFLGLNSTPPIFSLPGNLLRPADLHGFCNFVVLPRRPLLPPLSKTTLSPPCEEKDN